MWTVSVRGAKIYCASRGTCSAAAVRARSDIRPWLTDPEAALALLATTPPLLERQAQDGQMGMEEFLNSR